MARLRRGETPEYVASLRVRVGNGDLDAMESLAYILGREDSTAAEALELWRRAAQGGSLFAMTKLAGLLYQSGRVQEAEEWQLRAANTGDAASIEMLVTFYELTGNHGEAQRWLQSVDGAAEAGAGGPVANG